MSEMLPLQQERKFSKKKVTSDISESQATYTPAMSKSLKTPFNMTVTSKQRNLVIPDNAQKFLHLNVFGDIFQHYKNKPPPPSQLLIVQFEN